jgi:hypothetical protein
MAVRLIFSQHDYCENGYDMLQQEPLQLFMPSTVAAECSHLVALLHYKDTT